MFPLTFLNEIPAKLHMTVLSEFCRMHELSFRLVLTSDGVGVIIRSVELMI